MTDIVAAERAGVERVPDRVQQGKLTRVITRLEPYALLGLLILIFIFFSVLPASADTFPTTNNLAFLAGNQTITMLLAVAVVVPLVAGHFDFSVGAIAASTSVVAATAMSSWGAGIVVAVLVSIAAGLLIGLVNGVFVAQLGMNSFVSTLGVATLLGGLIQLRTSGRPIITGISPGLIRFGSSRWLGVPKVMFLGAIVVMIAWYVLNHTPYGRALYAIGSNVRASQLVGLPIRRYTLLAFVGSAALASVAGVVLTARTGGALADPGTSMLFPALAAAFLGATAVQRGRFNVAGTVIGVAFVSISVSGLTLAGADAWVNPVFNGIALLVAVAVSTLLARRQTAQ